MASTDLAAGGAPEPVRVLRIIARLNIGGPAIHTVLLTSGVQERGFDCTLVTGMRSETEGDMSYLAREAGIEPRVVAEIGRELTWRNDWMAFWKLVGIMRELRPTIVHTHTAKAGAIGRFAAIVARVPIIVHTFHGHVFHGYFGPRKTRAFLEIERWLGRFTTRIVAISERQRAELCETYRVAPCSCFTVIPLGFDLRGFAVAERQRGALRHALGVPEPRMLVGIVGRLVPIKNHAMFLDVARRILDAGIDADFIIVGDGESRPEIEDRVRELGLVDRMHFLGWRRDLDVIYADLDVVALTSNNEGTPVAVIEAMAAGRAVVSTAVGGVADVIEHEVSGLLVPAGDVDGFARATLDLLGNSSRRSRLGMAARHRALSRYGSERLVDDVSRLYRELLAEKRPATAAP